MFNSNLIFSTRKQSHEKTRKNVNALREVQAVNVHNIPHYIHVISECTPRDAVSNLCDRFRWALVKGALRGESGLGLTQAASVRDLQQAEKEPVLSAEPRPIRPTAAADSQATPRRHCHLLTAASHDSLCQHHTLELYRKFGRHCNCLRDWQKKGPQGQGLIFRRPLNGH